MINLNKMCSVENTKKYKNNINYWIGGIGFFKTGVFGWLLTGLGFTLFGWTLDISVFIKPYIIFGVFVVAGICFCIIMCRVNDHNLDICQKYILTKEFKKNISCIKNK